MRDLPEGKNPGVVDAVCQVPKSGTEHDGRQRAFGYPLNKPFQRIEDMPGQVLFHFPSPFMRHSCPWVAAVVDVPEFDVEMGITFGRAYRRVPQEFLECAQVHSPPE